MNYSNPISIQQAQELSLRFEKKSVSEILSWALNFFGDDLGLMTAMGYSGIVMMDHLHRLKPNFEPFFIDTGFHYQETFDLISKIEKLWSIKFKIVKPELSHKELYSKIGVNPWEINSDLCCLYMKVEPLLRVIHDKVAWLSAIRRDQSTSRSKIDIVEIDGRGTIKIYPLANWTSEDCWKYIHKHKLPYNVLHDSNYPSVGCKHCTEPVNSGEHERSGRWNSMPKLECGIHSHK